MHQLGLTPLRLVAQHMRPPVTEWGCYSIGTPRSRMPVPSPAPLCLVVLGRGPSRLLPVTLCISIPPCMQACQCGNIFADDAMFCRLCGTKRPQVLS